MQGKADTIDCEERNPKEKYATTNRIARAERELDPIRIGRSPRNCGREPMVQARGASWPARTGGRLLEAGRKRGHSAASDIAGWILAVRT